MSVLELAAIGLIGGVGAVARFVLDGAVSRRSGRDFPLGTMAVNLSGALLLGLLVGLAATGRVDRLIGTGFLGAYTTFSTWTLESHRLAEDGRSRAAALNFAASLMVGVAAAWVGRRVGAGL